MKTANLNVYTQNKSLVIEGITIKVRKKIIYDSIEEIIISPDSDTLDKKIYFYLSLPIQYENFGNSFWHFIDFKIFLFFHRNTLIYEEKFYDNELIHILTEVKKYITDIEIPKELYESNKEKWGDLKESKLIYSRNKLSLFDVFQKYDRVRYYQ